MCFQPFLDSKDDSTSDAPYNSSTSAPYSSNRKGSNVHSSSKQETAQANSKIPTTEVLRNTNPSFSTDLVCEFCPVKSKFTNASSLMAHLIESHGAPNSKVQHQVVNGPGHKISILSARVYAGKPTIFCKHCRKASGARGGPRNSGFLFKDKPTLYAHIDVAHSEANRDYSDCVIEKEMKTVWRKIYICDMDACNLSFDSEDKLKLHQSNHQPYKCPFCAFVMESRRHILWHIKKMHPSQVAQFDISKCQKMPSGLITSWETFPAGFPCIAPFCNDVFNDMGAWWQHVGDKHHHFCERCRTFYKYNCTSCIAQTITSYGHIRLV